LLLAASILVATAAPALAQATNPAVSAFNSCAMLYNAGKTDEAIAACDQAIALDPGKADAYFIKASALFGNAKIGSDGKYAVPPGTVEALNKYLELAPDGGHAPDVHAMLDALK
jgi:tetratricopeptide (TPR) repeat protein